MCQEARDNVLDAISVTNQKNLIKDVSLDQLSKNKKFQKFVAKAKLFKEAMFFVILFTYLVVMFYLTALTKKNAT